MSTKNSMFNDLPWVAKRVALVVGVLVTTLLGITVIHFSQDATILLVIMLFVLTHLWLLAWLTFSVRLLRHHGKLVSLQLRWRESNKVFTHLGIYN